MMGTQLHWSQKKRMSPQHDHISYLLCDNAVNRCIVVTVSSLNIHRTRLHGMNSVFRSSLLSQVFLEIDGPMCRSHLLSGESGFAREPASWLTNHPDLAEALEKWCESLAGVELDRHVRVKTWIGISSVSCGVGGVRPESRSRRPSRRRRTLECSCVLSWTVTAQRLLGAGSLCRRRAWRSA